MIIQSQEDIDSFESDFYEAILSLETPRDCYLFFRDLVTPAELKAMKERLCIAQMLERGGRSYREIAKDSGASLSTVTRVARFFNQEPYKGYRLVIEKMRKREREKPYNQ